tara:strand:- start:552 stop:1493 length:942 start_codon:yes stop_codon:yes gene_type:complete
MKQKYLNIFFQVIAIVLIIRIFFYENADFSKLYFLYSYNILLLFLLAIFAKLIITFLFFLLLNLVSSKKNSFINTSSFFLEGGIINQILPGLGFVYKYYKLNNDSNISAGEYATAQSIWSIFIFTAYIALAIFFGYTRISFSFISWIVLVFGLSIVTVFLLIFKDRIFFIFKNFLLKIQKINSFLTELKKIKDKLKDQVFYLIAIFCGFIFLGLLQCFNFFIGLIFFGGEVSFISSNYIFISSSLASIITMVNFFGLFELILYVSSSIFVPNLKDILIFAFAFRLINITATFSIILFFSAWKVIRRLGVIKTR